MKKLGLVGGTGPESTVQYYQNIIKEVQRREGIECYPTLSIESIDMVRMLEFCSRNDTEGLCAYLLDAMDALASAGADVAALTANTPHVVFDELSAQSPLPLVSIVSATLEEAKRRELRRVGLLGTRFTMQSDFYKYAFESEGIQICVPSVGDQAYINEKLFTEIELGIIEPQTQAGFKSIVERLQKDAAIEAIVLGCTELPLVFDGVELSLPALDTTDIHVKTLVDVILN